jgi:putative ABC transport system ATP-binding protein
VIALRDVAFQYGRRSFALRVDELSIAADEHVALIGPSGCGKSTLVALIAGLLCPQQGMVHVNDVAVSALSDAARRRFRAAQIGFVFQAFELIDYLSVRENLHLPWRFRRDEARRTSALTRLPQIAETLGIADKLCRKPARLSQGERQRVAIGRALLSEPAVIIADEPTGNLDPETARKTLELLLSAARETRATLVMVTHDHGLLERFDRVVDVRPFAGQAG